MIIFLMLPLMGVIGWNVGGHFGVGYRVAGAVAGVVIAVPVTGLLLMFVLFLAFLTDFVMKKMGRGSS
jgi:hypothetical protein